MAWGRNQPVPKFCLTSPWGVPVKAWGEPLLTTILSPSLLQKYTKPAHAGAKPSSLWVICGN